MFFGDVYKTYDKAIGKRNVLKITYMSGILPLICGRISLNFALIFKCFPVISYFINFGPKMAFSVKFREIFPFSVYHGIFFHYVGYL